MAPICAVVVLAVLHGCAVSGGHSGRSGQDAVDRAIRDVLATQQAAWNRGDIDAFMDGYWRSDELTFVSGGDVTKGWQPTLDRYKAKYTDRAIMGRLAFSDLNVRDLARDAALVFGRWHLERKEPIGGRFTLLFRIKHGRWVIVYDHTSVGA